jgi:hypothetical protein
MLKPRSWSCSRALPAELRLAYPVLDCQEALLPAFVDPNDHQHAQPIGWHGITISESILLRAEEVRVKVSSVKW